MRKDRDTDYQLPTGRGLDILDQRVQLRPHEGFAPEAIKVANPMRLEVGDGPNVAFAPHPPAWTEGAVCVDQWGLFDNPDADTFHDTVRPACLRCPAFFACTFAALEAEQPESGEGVLGANWRGGVWGGLRPTERARVAAGDPPAECSRGHDMRAPGGAHFGSGNARWHCATCNKESKAKRPKQPNVKVPCGLCPKLIVANSVTRHRRQVHGVETRREAA